MLECGRGVARGPREGGEVLVAEGHVGRFGRGVQGALLSCEPGRVRPIHHLGERLESWSEADQLRHFVEALQHQPWRAVDQCRLDRVHQHCDPNHRLRLVSSWHAD